MDNPFSILLVSVAFVLAATAIGRKLLVVLKVKTDAPVESVVFGIGLGLGVLGYLVLFAGLVGLLYWWVLIALAAAMALFGARDLVRTLREATNGLRSCARAKLRMSDGLLLFSSVVLGVSALICALSPPSGLDWDGLAYHLAVPKIYLASHSIFYVPFMSHSNFPFLTEMLYTVGLSLGSTGLAKLFHFWMYIGTAVAVYAMGRSSQLISPVVGKVGAVLFMSVPVALWEAGVAYADLATALYVTLAAYAVLNWERARDARWLVVCGILCGFALGTKVLAAVAVVALCLWILVAGGKEGWGRGLRLSLAVGLLALLIGSPWYVKSYVYTGNPVYPFMYDIFGGKYWSQSAADAYREAQLAFGMGRGAKEFLLLPWNLTMNGFKFFDHPSLFGLIGAAFLGLVPVAFLRGSYDKAILKISFIAAAFVVAWFVLMQQSRYLIGVLPLLSVAAASAVDRLDNRWFVGRIALHGFVVFCVIVGLVVGIVLASLNAGVVAGFETTEDYLSRTLGGLYPAEIWINENAPAGARVALFDEVRGFCLDREYMWANPGHHEMIPWSTFEGGGEMVDYFRERGYTHALVNWHFANAGDHLHNKLIGSAIGTGRMLEVFASGGVSVYEFMEK